MNFICCICNNRIERLGYNLKESKTIHSKMCLISIVKEIVSDDIFNINKSLNSNICIQCYELLNEADQFKMKLLKVCNKLKHIITQRSKKEIDSIETKSRNVAITPDIKSEYLEESTATNLLLDIVESNQDCQEYDIEIQESENVIKEEIPNYQELDFNSKLKQCSAEEKKYKCDCSKEFDNLNSLENHVKTHKFKSYICKLCGQLYKTKRSFNTHMKMHNGTKPFTCTFCNKSFTQKIALMRHLPLHTGVKPHQCDECGKCFVHHTSFKIHKLTHSGQKNYKCDICGEYFTTSSHLKRHSKSHTGEKRFECTVCGRKFAERYNLVVHQKVHSDNTDTSVRKRNYRCQICAESFEGRNKLEEHKTTKHLIISFSS